MNSAWKSDLRLHPSKCLSPCMNCPDRQVTASGSCHTGCERYEQYVAGVRAARERELPNRDGEADVVNYVVNAKLRNRRRNRT